MKTIGVKFQDWGKIYSFDSDNLELNEEDKIIVETEEGLAFGKVRIVPSEEAEESGKKALKKVVRKANEEDLMQLARNGEKENSAFEYCQQKINEMKLQMKLINVEYLFDGSKATFYFSAEERVDFRELVKDLASRFHTRIELRQVGVRDEARIKGGIGPCGRLLCCSTWIDGFEPVSVKMAKKQGLSLNPANISGMCGRLMCCLAFEYQNYVDGSMVAASAQKKEAAETTRPTESRPRQAKSKDRPGSADRPGQRKEKPQRSPERKEGEQRETRDKETAEGQQKKKKKRNRRRRFKKQGLAKKED